MHALVCRLFAPTHPQVRAFLDDATGWLFDPNTVEALLLFAAAMVALMGLMYEAIAVQGASGYYASAQGSVTAIVMLIIGTSIVYIVLALLVEIIPACLPEKSNAGGMASKRGMGHLKLGGLLASGGSGGNGSQEGGPSSPSMTSPSSGTTKQGSRTVITVGSPSEHKHSSSSTSFITSTSSGGGGEQWFSTNSLPGSNAAGPKTLANGSQAGGRGTGSARGTSAASRERYRVIPPNSGGGILPSASATSGLANLSRQHQLRAARQAGGAQLGRGGGGGSDTGDTMVNPMFLQTAQRGRGDRGGAAGRLGDILRSVEPPDPIEWATVVAAYGLMQQQVGDLMNSRAGDRKAINKHDIEGAGEGGEEHKTKHKSWRETAKARRPLPLPSSSFVLLLLLGSV